MAQALVAQRLNGAIQRINIYPLAKYYQNILTYSYLSNGKRHPPFEQLGHEDSVRVTPHRGHFSILPSQHL